MARFGESTAGATRQERIWRFSYEMAISSLSLLRCARSGKAASLRQRDQFIFLKDLPALVCEVGKSCFGIKESTSERFVSRLDLPVMGFYYGYTGLDETGQLDEQLMVQQAPTPSFFQRICLKLRGAPACAHSEDEESDAESTVEDEDEVDSDLILKVHRLDVSMFLLKEKQSYKDMNERDQRSVSSIRVRETTLDSL